MKKDKPLITFLTPTYNREKDLFILYKSLLKQKKCNFVWMIIDDGSTDNTQTTIASFKMSSPFKIILYSKENGGKHRALNYAIPLLSTPLTLVIDSDDYLDTDCSVTIEHYWNKYKKNKKIGSLIFERGKTSRNDPLVKINKEIIAPRTRYIEKNKLYGDYNDVFVTKYLKKFRIPEFKNEKFISESPLYNAFSDEYLSVFIDKVIAIGDYQSDGLTARVRELKLKNFHGALFETDQSIAYSPTLSGKIKHAVLFDYIAFGSSASILEALKKSNHLLLSLFCFPLGIVCYLMDRLKDRVE